MWSPKAFGAIPIPFTDSRELTVTEASCSTKLAWGRGLAGLSSFKDIAGSAFDVSTKHFPDPATVPAYVPSGREREWKNNDGHRDAFRHCFWNARLTKEFNYKWTQQFTTAHEALPGKHGVARGHGPLQQRGGTQHRQGQSQSERRRV